MSSQARITADLADPKWIKLLKLEASELGVGMKDVLVAALEVYFAEKLENGALIRAAESVFDEWDNPLDREYDDL